MKKVIIAIVGLIISLLFSSCSDITDIGNVHKFPIFPLLPPTGSTLVKPDSTYWLIVEGYPYEYEPATIIGFPWGKKMKFLKNVITIDTLTENPVISIDIQIESTFPDVSLQDRKDRVNSFRIKLDSIMLNRGTNIKSEEKIENWFELYVKTIKDQKVYYLNQDELNIDWMFAFTSEDIISGYFIVGVPPSKGFQTQLLTITFDLYYPNKKGTN